MKTQENLRIAIQKSGRLGEESIDLLKKSGFSFSLNSRTLIARSKNFPLDILFLRVGDIPSMVKEGVIDLGIVGENSLEEKQIEEIEIVEYLDFGKCDLCLASPLSSNITTLEDFNNTVVATSYINLTKKYFEKKGISADVIEMSGSHEIAPQMGLADGICDIVSTGSTLVANKLRNIETIFSSQAVLIGKKDAKKTLETKRIDDFLLRLHSVLRAKKLKSVTMNAPQSALEKIEEILPSLESPTIMPLVKKDWFAVHSVIEENEAFWDTIEELKKSGANGILISPVERVID